MQKLYSKHKNGKKFLNISSSSNNNRNSDTLCALDGKTLKKPYVRNDNLIAFDKAEESGILISYEMASKHESHHPHTKRDLPPASEA